MQTCYIILAGLLSFTAADNNFLYKTSVRRGFIKNHPRTKYHYNIAAGQCSTVINYMNVCLQSVPSAGIKVSVKDNSPYPEININESLALITVNRTPNTGGCVGPARVSLKVNCLGGVQVSEAPTNSTPNLEDFQSFNTSQDLQSLNAIPDENNEESLNAIPDENNEESLVDE